MNRMLISRKVGWFGQKHLKSAESKERMPEGIVLIHVQAARDTHNALSIFLYRSVEQSVIFIIVDIGAGNYIFAFVSKDFLAFITGVIGVAVGEGILLNIAAVFATLAI